MASVVHYRNVSVAEYNRESERLAQLTRAQRFDQLLDFPIDFSFKVIGRRGSLFQNVRALLDARQHEDVILVERASATGKFVSITFILNVSSGEMIDEIYSALEGLPSVSFIF